LILKIPGLSMCKEVRYQPLPKCRLGPSGKFVCKVNGKKRKNAKSQVKKKDGVKTKNLYAM
jgi:hypothetical protein